MYKTLDNRIHRRALDDRPRTSEVRDSNAPN
jgi:hypothetical protein